MEKYFFAKQSHIQVKIIGIMLISLGIVFYFVHTSLSIKIGLTAGLIGILLILLMPEYIHSKTKGFAKGRTTCPTCKHKFAVDAPDDIEKYEVTCPICENKFTIQVTSDTSKSKSKLLMPEKITLAITIWILVIFFITGEADIETFFILVFIGMLIIKVLANEFITVHLKNRMNIFIYVFLIVFIVIEGNKIISFLGM